MANRSLAPEQIREMEMLLEAGFGPDQISKHLNVGVSTVHNYRKELELQKQIKFESLRGKKPLEVDTDAYILVRTSHEKDGKTITIKEALEEAKNLDVSNIMALKKAAKAIDHETSKPKMVIVMNGVAIEIKEGTRSVEVDPAKNIILINS